jgi:hypothetical protein
MRVHELSIGSETMKHKALIAAAAALTLGAAAPTYAQNTSQVLRGTGIGAAGGAVAGALIPGLGVGEKPEILPRQSRPPLLREEGPALLSLGSTDAPLRWRVA